MFGCKKGEKIEKCGDLEVIEKILHRADIKIEGHEVEVQEDLCLHKLKVKDKTLVVYYLGGFYFVGVAFNEKGMPVGVEK